MNESNFRFPNSKPLVIFSEPFFPEAISFVSIPLSFSKEALRHLSDHWLMQLKKKQTQLHEQGISSEIKLYSTSDVVPIEALFVNAKPVMWPGNCVTLRDWSVNEHQAELSVSEISYPFISALSDQNFSKNRADENLLPLRPPLAICTFAITADNFLVLTARGTSTNVYPGRFYGQGGNPEHIQINLLQHQLEEMEDELLIKPGEVIPDSLRFFGIIEDEETFPRKPDLIGSVNISISSAQLKERFESRLLSHRPPDVADIRFVKFDEESLMHFLRSETQSKDFCPPAHGGLLLTGLFQFGKEWLDKLIRPIIS